MSKHRDAVVNLVVAHGLEAKPLIQAFDLHKVESATPYPQYSNDDNISLIICGMGRHSAYSATENFARHAENTREGLSPAWLNVGIAGHKSLAIGEGVMAHKITERATAKSYFPSIKFPALPSSELITVDEPELSYPEDVTYEMEASGFVQAATQTEPIELVHVFKIISDNPQHSVEKIDSAFIRKCIEGQLSELGEIVNDLLNLSEQFNRIYRELPEYSLLLNSFHFTVTQQHQLKRLCQRYHALGKLAELDALSRQMFSSAKQLLAALRLALGEVK